MDNIFHFSVCQNGGAWACAYEFSYCPYYCKYSAFSKSTLVFVHTEYVSTSPKLAFRHSCVHWSDMCVTPIVEANAASDKPSGCILDEFCYALS